MATAQDFVIDGPAGKLSVRAKGLEGKRPSSSSLSRARIFRAYNFSFDGRDDYRLERRWSRAATARSRLIRGYRDSELSDHAHSVKTDKAIAETAAVIDWAIAQGYERPHLLGWSRGGPIAGPYAETRGDRIDRLVMLDLAIGGGNMGLFPEKDSWWSQ